MLDKGENAGQVPMVNSAQGEKNKTFSGCKLEGGHWKNGFIIIIIIIINNNDNNNYHHHHQIAERLLKAPCSVNMIRFGGKLNCDSFRVPPPTFLVHFNSSPRMSNAQKAAKHNACHLGNMKGQATYDGRIATERTRLCIFPVTTN